MVYHVPQINKILLCTAVGDVFRTHTTYFKNFQKTKLETGKFTQIHTNLIQKKK